MYKDDDDKIKGGGKKTKGGWSVSHISVRYEAMDGKV